MMLSFLYNVPARQIVANQPDISAEILANFETESSIAKLIDHIGLYIPDMSPVNLAELNWEALSLDQRIFNYTYGFGLLRESVGPTLRLEALGADYIGATPQGLFWSANKPHMSALLRSRGFLCPLERIVCQPLSDVEKEQVSRQFKACDYLVLKPAYEESSIGLRLVPNNSDQLAEAIKDLFEELPGAMLVQEYVDGLDVTVPMLGRRSPFCLPAVALQHDRPINGPFIFDPAMKASKALVHYADISDWPRTLRESIYTMALTAFALGFQRDYSRMDCRVTPEGQCYFLEVNANPQLGLDKASFSVSARSLGLDIGRVIKMILDDDIPVYGNSPFSLGL